MTANQRADSTYAEIALRATRANVRAGVRLVVSTKVSHQEDVAMLLAGAIEYCQAHNLSFEDALTRAIDFWRSTQ